MPLDPQARALLDQMAAAGGPPLDSLTPEEARGMFAGMLELAGPPEEVAKVEDRVVPGPAGDIPVRVYTPQGNGPFPVVLYFHGGGWVIGDIESHDAPCRALANASGCVVVSVHYRLAPEHRFPAAADDCYAVTRYVAENAGAFHADATRLAVAGDSAGGNLAAVVPLMARDRGGPSIALQVLVYPVTDHSYGTLSYAENAEGYLLTRASMVWFWEHYLGGQDGAHPYASPLRAEALTGLPPALVITAEFDPLRDEGEAYAKRLKDAAVPVELRRYDGMIHGFFQLGGVLPQGREAIGVVAQTLRRQLAGAAAPA